MQLPFSTLATVSLFMFMASPGLAQQGLPELPPTQTVPSSTAPHSPNNRSAPTPPSDANTLATETVLLTATDVVTLLLQNNRELRNAALERIAQRQALQEAESIFDPDVTPTLRVGISDTTNTTEITREATLGAALLTPLGTNLEITIDALDDPDINLTVTQPLIRGTGRAVNTSPVKVARLEETNNQLALRQQLITDITNGILSYHALVRSQASLQIQQLSFATQQQQRQSVEALVNAGRRAQFDLVEIDANLATTETSVLEAQNDLDQAQSNLLNLLDLETTIEIEIPDEILNVPSAIAQANELEPLDELMVLAFANRPDYRQAQLALQIAELNGVVDADNRRWNLDLRANASTDDFAETSAELVLTRLLEDESVDTAFQRNQVTQQQLNNDLARLETDIRLEVSDRLRDVESARNRIEATRLARELAKQRLENARARARRGRTRDIFEVLELQNDLVEAQNSEVNAAIDLEDAIATLNQSLGTTLIVWSEQVNASQLLDIPTVEAP